MKISLRHCKLLLILLSTIAMGAVGQAQAEANTPTIASSGVDTGTVLWEASAHSDSALSITPVHSLQQQPLPTSLSNQLTYPKENGALRLRRISVSKDDEIISFILEHPSLQERTVADLKYDILINSLRFDADGRINYRYLKWRLSAMLSTDMSEKHTNPQLHSLFFPSESLDSIFNDPGVQKALAQVKPPSNVSSQGK